MKPAGISVVIPTHPGRSWDLLGRAVRSVYEQTLRPDEIILAVDNNKRGAGATRQQGLERAGFTHTAFLDSDDEFLPMHLDTLYTVMVDDPDIIMAFTWFTAVGMPDPLGHFGLPFDPQFPYHSTVTTMVRTDVALECGGFPTAGEGSTPGCLNDDFVFELRMCGVATSQNKKIVHIPARTWKYHGHGGNTSGRSSHGDAR